MIRVTGRKTTVQLVNVEIDENEVKSVVDSQTTDYLISALQRKLKEEFVASLPPSFAGKREIQKDTDGELTLVHVDASWDHHNNVGIDKDVRVLTGKEQEEYLKIVTLSEYIRNKL